MQYGAAPIWRKTRTQAVDEKVSKLFESYKLIDRAQGNIKATKGYQGPFNFLKNAE